MELTCPHCEARYRVPADAIPLEGRTIQCAKCGQSWLQPGPDEERALADASATEVLSRSEPLGQGIPDIGAIDSVTLPAGPAADAPLQAWVAAEPARGPGLGTVGWVLLLLVIALLAAGGYAYYTGMLKFP